MGLTHSLGLFDGFLGAVRDQLGQLNNPVVDFVSPSPFNWNQTMLGNLPVKQPTPFPRMQPIISHEPVTCTGVIVSSSSKA